MRRVAERTSAVCAALWLWAVLTGGDAHAEGLRRIDAAWLVPSYLSAAAVAGGAAPTRDGAWLRAGQMRLFGLEALPARGVAVGWRGTGSAAVEVAWEAVGCDAFRDERGLLRAEVGGRWRVGAQASWRRLQPGAGARLSQRAVDAVAGCSVPMGALGTCDLRVHVPLLRDGLPAMDPEPDRRLRLAVAGRGRAVALAVDGNPDGRPSGSWEVLCGIGGGAGVAWRADGGSGAMGGGFIWQRGPLRLRTSHLAHPELGLTHRFEVAFGRPEASPW
jgi:hypothetical protein